MPKDRSIELGDAISSPIEENNVVEVNFIAEDEYSSDEEDEDEQPSIDDEYWPDSTKYYIEDEEHLMTNMDDDSALGSEPETPARTVLTSVDLDKMVNSHLSHSYNIDIRSDIGIKEFNIQIMDMLQDSLKREAIANSKYALLKAHLDRCDIIVKE